MKQNYYELLADWLDSEAAEVRALEKRAYSALYDDKDEPVYRELMRMKAVRLADLAANSTSYLQNIDEHDHGTISGRIERFSASASKSLEIGSIFFMSALLYPEGYSDGENNDLENFADMVRRFG